MRVVVTGGWILPARTPSSTLRRSRDLVGDLTPTGGAPILEEIGFPGTVFVVTSFVESGEPLSWSGIDQWLRPDTADVLRSLTWQDAETLIARGWEIGPHTTSRPLLTRTDDVQLAHDWSIPVPPSSEGSDSACPWHTRTESPTIGWLKARGERATRSPGC